MYVQNDTTTTIWTWGTSEITINGKLFKDAAGNVWWFAGQMVLVFFTLFLFWTLVKAWFSFSKITSEVSTWLFKFAEDSMKMIPLPWLGVGVWWVKKAFDEATNEGNFTRRQDAEADKMFAPILDKMWFEANEAEWWISSWDTKTLEDTYRAWDKESKASNFWKAMHGITKEKQISYKWKTKSSITKWLTGWEWFKYLASQKVLSKAYTSMDELSENTKDKNNLMRYIDTVLDNGWNTYSQSDIQSGKSDLSAETRWPKK